MAIESDGTPEFAAVKQGGEGLTAFRLPEYVRTTHGPEGGTVLDIHNGQLFRLNVVGSRILELLKQGLGVSDIAHHLALAYGIECTTAEDDVCEFIRTLRNHRLLTP